MGSVAVVLDTNVVISALGFGGTPLEAFLETFEDDVTLLASEATLSELDRAMQYDHLPRSESERLLVLAIFRREAALVDPNRSVSSARDPDDDKFLELALEGEADYLVSGDSDLLSLAVHEGTEIVDPATFLDISR